MIDSSKIDNLTATLNRDKAATPQKASEKAAGTLAKNFDDFLLLLTTQLKNQDPTEPLDSNQFTEQLVSMAGVEQQIASNSQLENIAAALSAQSINNSINYIGKWVEASSDKVFFDGSGAGIVYDLGKEAQNVDISISDATGKVVFSGDGSKSAGRNEVVWKGLNSITGQTMPPGVYTVKITAKDSTGADIKSTVSTFGRVNSVDLKDGKAMLAMGDLSLSLDKVLAIREAPQLADDSATSGNDTATPQS